MGKKPKFDPHGIHAGTQAAKKERRHRRLRRILKSIYRWALRRNLEETL